MLQRIQTLYLLIAIISLLIITFGTNIFSFDLEKEHEVDVEIAVNVFGTQASGTIELTEETETKKMYDFLKLKERANRVAGSPIISFPFYLITIFMTMLSVATLLSYKKLETQQKLGRFNFVFLVLGLVFVSIAFYGSRSQLNSMLEDLSVISRLGLGYYLLIVATAFAFLANLGVKRDLNLIKSIDRIR